jgi:hypothetical protein
MVGPLPAQVFSISQQTMEHTYMTCQRGRNQHSDISFNSQSTSITSPISCNDRPSYPDPATILLIHSLFYLSDCFPPPEQFSSIVHFSHLSSRSHPSHIPYAYLHVACAADFISHDVCRAILSFRLLKSPPSLLATVVDPETSRAAFVHHVRPDDLDPSLTRKVPSDHMWP